MAFSLSANINDAVTTIPVLYSDFNADGGVVQIESEQILYTSATDKALLGCTRGYNGTTAVLHLAGKGVTFLSATIKNYNQKGLRLTNAADPSSAQDLVTKAYVDAVPGVGASVDASEINSGAAADGTVLTADGAGAAAWEAIPAPAPTTPGGANTQVQYNSSGAFAGASGLTYNNVTNQLSVADDKKLILSPTEGGYIRHSLDHSMLLINTNNAETLAEIAGAGNIHMYANTATDGSGFFYPAYKIDNANMNVSADALTVATGTFVTPHSSAQLQADSTSKGFLPPRMTTAEKTGIGTPAHGLIVFDTTLQKLCVYTSSGWETITSA